ncbi:DUF4089 domain-containing protein [Mangrovimicrobium sediminis]|uniref:DUF4089 domain-containing protein n=1 Tax=Mangrovimicrobium sediminis TaxID=2562682 RepID=A0A4Z0M594_9GAMM|nr:DUF4089 domain-containing protein [Haliea sp. SAOS-164]TGD74590.1 DUF4089 domain-containing protein [Haliea sp. SAOS-164]
MKQVDMDMLEQLSALAGVDIPEDSRAGVLAHLRVAQGMAEKVFAAPLPADALEPAPVFRPWSCSGLDNHD